MKIDQKLSDRINELIRLGESVLATEYDRDPIYGSRVDQNLFKQFETASLSFIVKLYSKDHPYYESFYGEVEYNYASNVVNGIAVLRAIKIEIDNGWLATFKELISSEMFTDFLEMAEYFLKDGFKDASAVIIGSVLEENLRMLCSKNNIPTEEIKDGKTKPKKAESMNSELYTNEVYNKGDNKHVTAWLDIRNSAAHGKYDEYTKEQVDIMFAGVQNFIVRNS